MLLPNLDEIRNIRRALNLTQEKLANLVIVDGQSISRVLINMIEMQGHSPNYKIAKAIFWVLDQEENKNKPGGKRTAGKICNGHGKYKLKTIGPKKKLKDTKKKMGNDGQITQLPVIDNSEECVGLITQLSMVDKPLTTIVEKVMVGKPPTIDENMEITPGIKELLVNPQSCILVSYHNSHKLKGIITPWELLREKGKK